MKIVHESPELVTVLSDRLHRGVEVGRLGRDEGMSLITKLEDGVPDCGSSVREGVQHTVRLRWQVVAGRLERQAGTWLVVALHARCRK